MQKLFLTLENTQDDIVLSGEVWLDETFYSVISEDIVHNEDGSKLRGLSNNQICIGVANIYRRQRNEHNEHNEHINNYG